jgi:hypothetical protein
MWVGIAEKRHYLACGIGLQNSELEGPLDRARPKQNVEFEAW